LSAKVASQKNADQTKEKILLDKYLKLKKRYGDIKTLESKKEKIDKLNRKVEELRTFKYKLEQNGTLAKLQSYEKYDRSKLSDPRELAAQLKKFGLYNGTNKMLYGVRQIGIGNVFPSYSPLILDGIQVIGGLVEINPGLLYLAFTTGKS